MRWPPDKRWVMVARPWSSPRSHQMAAIICQAAAFLLRRHYSPVSISTIIPAANFSTHSSQQPLSLSAIATAVLDLQDPSQALAFFNRARAAGQLGQSKASSTARCIAAIVHVLSRAGLYPQAVGAAKELIQALDNGSPGARPIGSTVFRALLDISLPTPTAAFDIVIVALSQTGRTEEALWVFRQVKHLPAVQACNSLLDGLLKMERRDDTWKLYDEMLGRGLCPTVVTYNTLINACRYQGDISRALWLFHEMVAANIKPTVVTYTTVICCLCEDDRIREAMELFVAMREDDVHPNIYTYNTIINGHFSGVNILAAFELYREMLRGGLLPNVVTFGVLVDGLCKAGDMRKAKETFAHMVKYGVPPNVFVYNSLIDGYCRVGDLTNAFELSSEMSKADISPDLFTCSILVKGLCDAGRLQEGFDFLIRMKREGLIVNDVVYNILVNGYCEKGNLEEALNLCSHMSEEGIDPNVVTFSSLMNGHCKAGNLEGAMMIYTEMKIRGLIPDVVACTSLIDGHSKNGKLKEAFRLTKEMTEMGVTPNAFTFSCLLDGLCREGRTNEAIDLFVKTMGSNCGIKIGKIQECLPDLSGSSPNAITYMTMIYGLYRDRQHFTAGKFYSLMRESGLVPDAFTYTILMRMQHQHGHIRNAMILLADMLKTGIMLSESFMFYALHSA